MEKVPEAFYWSTPKLVLYREDIDSIVSIFQRHGEDIQIVVGTFRLSNVSELDAVPLESTNELSIKSERPRVSLELGGLSGQLFAAAQDGPAGRGFAEEVRDALRECEDRWRRVASAGGLVAPALALSSIIVAAALTEPLVSGLAAVFTVAMVLYAVWAWRERSDRHVRVLLKRHSEVPGFIERNRDQIAMNVGFMVLGGLLTKLLGL